MTGFSVLMAVYAGDRADWLSEAIDSLRAQTRPADEIVIVEDGPVSAAVAQVLDAAGDLPVRRVRLPHNVGLGAALQAGLLECRHDLVVRADSDDINEPARFERQVSVMVARPALSVLGGYVAEFACDPQVPYAIRTVPVGEREVARVARWRCPLNHPAVILRKSDVERVGGYAGFTGIEDYYLWGKLLAAGLRLDNLPEVLVRQRAGAAMGRRRGGWGYARTEVALFRAFVRIGFLTWPQAAAGLLLRLPVRIVPDGPRIWIYRHLLRRTLPGELT